MAASIKFTCTSLAGLGKEGILPADEHGYRPVILGALDVFNSAGEWYCHEEAVNLFLSSGALQRRIKDGVLKGELGHPKFVPGMRERDYLQRVMQIYEDNVAAHYSEIWLNYDDVKDPSGNKVIAIMGKVKGSGPHGQALENSLSNPKENVCFSIRAFTDDVRKNGVNNRILREIVTWDVVTEPGIAVAKKFTAPALEEFRFSRANMETVVKQTAARGLAQESSVILHGQALCKVMGWDTIPQKDLPAFLRF